MEVGFQCGWVSLCPLRAWKEPRDEENESTSLLLVVLFNLGAAGFTALGLGVTPLIGPPCFVGLRT